MMGVERALEDMATTAEKAAEPLPPEVAVLEGMAAGGSAAEADATVTAEGLEQQGIFAYCLAVVSCRPATLCVCPCTVLLCCWQETLADMVGR
jgi:hypothetical protein